MHATLNELIPILQTAIGPVILISGVGLLILSMTNRLGRAIDRARSLAGKYPQTPAETQLATLAQLRTLWRRAKMLRLAIGLASLSVLLAGVLIISLFLTALFHFEIAWLISGIFVGCLASLIGALLAFMYDMQLSLAALKVEMEKDTGTQF
ncbi:MAG: DUF2721 domain-containing protein [Anaerolineales bacterium]|nr:DUF2721 domain-containing protein [Anaerolineales bacterium]